LSLIWSPCVKYVSCTIYNTFLFQSFQDH